MSLFAAIGFGGITMITSFASFSSRSSVKNYPDIISHQMFQQPDYAIGSSNLSSRWLDLVEQGKVTATVTLPPNDKEATKDITSITVVEYGLRFSESKQRIEEFVRQIDGVDNDERIATINRTLTNLQETNDEDSSSSSSSSLASTVKYGTDGNLLAQLQLIRTLRPAPSPGFSATGKSSSVPPPYDAETDSFVVGPLRLELRPKADTIDSSEHHGKLATSWDVFHNVSPADARGHFLLVPDLDDRERNWRGQVLTVSDRHDLVQLASAIRPTGSLGLGFNSVGAGASQNHVHVHAWPCPTLPHFLEQRDDRDRELGGWECYAASRSNSIRDFVDAYDGRVETSLLDYPVFCVLLSASRDDSTPLANALSVCLDAVGERPHNVFLTNRPRIGDDDDDDEPSSTDDGCCVDVYVFARSKERSDVLPSMKLGVSEMMGVFHAQSEGELREMTTTSENDRDEDVDRGLMARALEDVSAENEEDLWEMMKISLSRLR